MSIRRRLLWLVFAVWFPAVAGFGLLAWFTYQEDKAATLRQVELYGQRVSAYVERELDKRVVLAAALASSSEARRAEFAQFHLEASNATDGTGAWALLVDANSQFLNTKAPFPSERIPRAKPIALTEGHPRIVYVAQAPVARRPAITVFVPVPGMKPQQFNVGLAFEPSVLQAILSVNPGPFKALTAVVNGEHVIMARSRDPDSWFGKSVSTAFEQRIRAGGVGFAESTTLDGIPSMTYLSPPSAYGWSVVISVPMTELDAAAELASARALGASTLLLLIGLAFALSGTRWMGRTVDALEASALQLGNNEVPSQLQTGLSEVDAVSAALHTAGLKIKDANATLEQRVLEAVRSAEAAQARLLHGQKLEVIGRLTAGVAHDFNNLLQTIGAAQHLLSRRLKSEEEQRLMQGAVRAVSKAGDLVKQLMVFGRVETLEPTTVSIADVVLHSQELTRAAVGERISLSAELEPGLPYVLVDPVQFELALLNLVFNARDALPAGGGITIRARVATEQEARAIGAGGFVRLEVADDGEGMSAEVQARVFEPYFTTKPVGSGSGLGLAQVHSFARQSGGDITLISELGRGTQICMYLPVAIHPAPTAKKDASPSLARSGLRLLMVEDDVLVSSIIQAALEDEGYRVRLCGTADEAATVLSADREFDILFTDVVMPGKMNGVDLVHWCMDVYPDLPVVVTTGYAENLSGLTGPILRKPYEIDTLFAALQQAYDAALPPPAGDQPGL